MKHTNMSFKVVSSLLLFVLCFGLLSGCGDTKKTKQIFAMDTIMELTAYGDNADAGLSSAIQTINKLDKQFDPEYEKSEVYALNQGNTVTVSDPILDMLDTASLTYTRSGGALNIALYPVIKAWGFIDSEYRVPDASELQALLAETDFHAIQIEDHDVTLPENMELSFGALAKGCASEYVIDSFRKAGVEYACISLGGNVQTLGTKPDGSLWSVAVTNPKDTGSAVGVIQIGEAAVVTSGDYQRYFEAEDGTRYHHILDPATGYPTDNGLRSVTIVCDNGTTADALSTAMFVLGEEGAISYMQEFGGFEMILITDDGRVIVSGGLADSFTETDDSWNYVYLEDEKPVH